MWHAKIGANFVVEHEPRSELQRGWLSMCVLTMTNPAPQSQKLSAKNRTSRIVTALAVIGFGAAVFALPFWYVRSKKNQNVNLYAKAGPLSPAEKMRGAYM